MLVQLAWRNIWRNKTRSLIVISSIAIGLWAGIFILAFAWGMYKNNIDETVFKQLSHLQIHHPLFSQENDAKFIVPQSNEIVEKLKSQAQVSAVSSRVITSGMISSTTTARGVKIIGIDPASEKKQVKLHEIVWQGDYFETGKENEILIGEKLAKKLKLKLKSKVVLTFTDVNSEIISGAYRVGGIYRSGNLSLDEVNVYVLRPPFREILGLSKNETNEIAILLKNESVLTQVKEFAKSIAHGLKVEDWKEMAPELRLVIESFNLYTYIITGIILLALTFGIVNTMLMSVLERVRELGMLMAIGLNKLKIFLMIMLETLYLSLIGCPIGLLIGWLTVKLLGNYGINISMFSEGLTTYGFSPMIYPALDGRNYVIVAVMCLITALLSAIYPSYKALQLNPSEAIRKI
ncbi:ABC transporter permease [Salegentibacter sediminis]|uniref:ABC transporter permease n=1 Tax=Salegentibacter sediminis TaxID=1930251 RepID=UPI0009BE5510|nr:FtsX-like permease family protein [Salegentibacter sediminis]